MKHITTLSLCLLTIICNAQFSAEILSPQDGEKIPASLVTVVIHTTAPGPAPEPELWGWNIACWADGVLIAIGYQFPADAVWTCDYQTKQKGPHVIVAQIANHDYSVVATHTITVHR